MNKIYGNHFFPSSKITSWYNCEKCEYDLCINCAKSSTVSNTQGTEEFK